MGLEAHTTADCTKFQVDQSISPAARPAPLSDHLPCEICGGPIEKRRDESKTRFATRRVCGKECQGKIYSKNRSGKARGSYKPTWGHPSCIAVGCNNPVSRRDGEKFARWRVRKYCAECFRAIRLAGIKKANERRQKIKEALVMPVGPSFHELCFSDHNIKPRDGGFIRLFRPETYVEAISVMGSL